MAPLSLRGVGSTVGILSAWPWVVDINSHFEHKTAVCRYESCPANEELHAAPSSTIIKIQTITQKLPDRKISKSENSIPASRARRLQALDSRYTRRHKMSTTQINGDASRIDEQDEKHLRLAVSASTEPLLWCSPRNKNHGCEEEREKSISSPLVYEANQATHEKQIHGQQELGAYSNQPMSKSTLDVYLKRVDQRICDILASCRCMAYEWGLFQPSNIPGLTIYAINTSLKTISKQAQFRSAIAQIVAEAYGPDVVVVYFCWEHDAEGAVETMTRT